MASSVVNFQTCQICRRISACGNHPQCTKFSRQKPRSFTAFIDAIQTLDQPDRARAIVRYSEARSVTRMMKIIDEASQLVDSSLDPQARGILSSLKLGFDLLKDEHRPNLTLVVR